MNKLKARYAGINSYVLTCTLFPTGWDDGLLRFRTLGTLESVDMFECCTVDCVASTNSSCLKVDWDWERCWQHCSWDSNGIGSPSPASRYFEVLYVLVGLYV